MGVLGATPDQQDLKQGQGSPATVWTHSGAEVLVLPAAWMQPQTEHPRLSTPHTTGSGPVFPGCLENPVWFVLLLSLCLFAFLLHLSSSESKNLPHHEPLDGQPLTFLVKLIIEAGYSTENYTQYLAIKNKENNFKNNICICTYICESHKNSTF